MTAPQVAPGFPKMKGATKPWRCPAKDPACTRDDPCRKCRGRKSQSVGAQQQHRARKALEHVTGTKAARFAGQLANEEQWTGLPLRVEVKAGAQCDPIWNPYARAEGQSHAAKPVGDMRPFAMIAMGQRTTDGLFICRLSELGRVVESLVNL